MLTAHRKAANRELVPTEILKEGEQVAREDFYCDSLVVVRQFRVPYSSVRTADLMISKRSEFRTELIYLPVIVHEDLNQLSSESTSQNTEQETTWAYAGQ